MGRCAAGTRLSASNDALIISTLEPARHSVYFCGVPFGLSIFLYLPLNRRRLFASWWFWFPLRSSLFSPPSLAFPLLFATCTFFNAPSNTVSSSLPARRRVSEALRLSVMFSSSPSVAVVAAAFNLPVNAAAETSVTQRFVVKDKKSSSTGKRQSHSRLETVPGGLHGSVSERSRGLCFCSAGGGGIPAI